MQPYFFPYLGYFNLINSVDNWIVFDTVQYIRHGWINRNRILHPNTGWQYIIIPIRKYSRNTPIKDIEISDQTDWRQRILGQLMHYKKQAPFFEEIFELVEDCLSIDEIALSNLNVSILQKICDRLGVQFRYLIFSKMDLRLGPIEGPGDWALRIAKALGASECINPSGGGDLFDREKFEEHGVKLTIKNYKSLEYKCGGYEFIPNLSIIDTFMWNSTAEIKAYLDDQI